MNRSWGLLAVAGLAIGATACGRGDDDDNAGGSAPGGSASGGSQSSVAEGAAKGSIDVWAMGTEGEKLDAIAKDFTAKNPDVSVKVTAIPWDAAHDKIVNAIAANQVPDVSLIGTTWMGEFAKLGGLEPTPDNVDSSQFFKGAWDSTVVDGVSYGVPWYVETRVVYYRTDITDKGGFSKAPADWDQLRQLAEAAQKGGAKYGISLQPGGTGSWQTFMPFFWQAGGEIMDDQGNFTLDSDACTKALTYYDSFFKDGLAQKSVSDVPVEGQFSDGSVGSFISGPWMIGVVTDAGADPSTFTVAEQPKEESQTSFVGGGDLAVMKQSDNKPAAWAFVDYMSQPEVQVKFYEAAKDLPAVQSAWDDKTLAGDKMLSVFGDQLQDAKSPPAIPSWEQVAAAIDSEIEKVTVGGTSPEDGCKAMQQQAESIGTGL